MLLPLLLPVAGRISTGCNSLDSLLGGGLSTGTITQFYGPPASGKTNISLNSAVTTATNESTVIYVDTEGFSPDRLEQILPDSDTDEITERIIVKEAFDFTDQQEAIREVKDLSAGSSLIILDSATGFYRIERSDNDSEALKTITRQLTVLLSLARRHNLAVLVTNQVYSDLEGDQVQPLGGHTFAHWTGVIVRLDRFRGGNRRATLEKHQSEPAGETARFKITGSGITDVE